MRQYNGSDFTSADAHLGKLDGITIGNNTRLERRGPDAIGVRLHGTYVVTYTRAGDAILNASHYHTVTTAERLNRYSPSPWRVGSDRGTWKLYRSGHPIADFGNGLTIRADGSVGTIDIRNGYFGSTVPDVTPLMSADQVQAAVDADIARRDEREAKRLARQSAEHPTARPVTYRADLAHSRYGFDTPLPSPHGRRRAYDCPSCRAERDAWQAIRQETLRQDHPNRHAWAVTVNGGTISEPAGECPYDCPDRPSRW